MFVGAFVVTKHDLNARVDYQQQRSKGQRCGSAVVRVARERCGVISAMLQPTQPLAQSIVALRVLGRSEWG